jgi:serine protease Do
MVGLRYSLFAFILALNLWGCRTYQRVANDREWSWTPEAAYAKYFYKRGPDKFEGVWPWIDSTVVIVKEGPTSSPVYKGYSVKSRYSSWFAGDQRFVVSPTAEPGVFEGTEFLRTDRSQSKPLRIRFSPSGMFIQLIDKESFSLATRIFPQPTETFREAFIAEYTSGRPLEAIEGAWLIANNQYEVGIIRNPFVAGRNYAFIAVVLESRVSADDVGQVKILLRETAAPKLLPADFRMRSGFQGTNLLIEGPNHFKFILTEGRGYYKSNREYYGIRTYPIARGISNETAEAKDNLIATGTGFLIAPDLVITNFHVIQDARTVTVSFDGASTKAFIAAKDTSNDLVILKLAKRLPVSALRLGEFASVRVGEPVYTIGFPLASELGQKHRLGEGIVNSSVGMQDEPRMFQVSVPIQPGNSGGPLLDQYGDVIGIVTSTANPFFFAKFHDTIPQNIGFAVKVSYLDVLLKEVDYSKPGPQSTKVKLTAADIMERSRQAVVLVEARN